MAVTEFVLSELFQDKWRSPDRQARPEIKAWARIQQRRMLRTFLWHIRMSEEATGSPWMHLKRSIPKSDWFLREDITLKNPQSYLKH